MLPWNLTVNSVVVAEALDNQNVTTARGQDGSNRSATVATAVAKAAPECIAQVVVVMVARILVNAVLAVVLGFMHVQIALVMGKHFVMLA